MGVIRQLGKAFLSACLPASRLLVHGRVVGRGVRPALALTFDDGPDPVHTPRLLDECARAGFRATFFVLGKKVAAQPDLARRIVAEGHELGNHTWSHADPALIGAADFLKEVEDTALLLQDVCGIDCRLTRPPNGKLTWGKMRGLWRLGQTVALWNVDSKDYCMSDARQMQDWCAGYRPRHGDILLFHDNHPFAEVALQDMHQRGVFSRFAGVAISEWLAGDSIANPGAATVIPTAPIGERPHG